MIDWSDLNAIFRIAFILTISSFALFLPLNILIGNKLAPKFVIPVSISFQIIFGYIFYCLGLTKYYPLVYILIVLGANIWSFWRLKSKGSSGSIFKKQSIIACIVPIILFCVIIYNRFSDSFTTVAPGEIDTYNHLVFLKDLIKDGVLSFPQYAPGFHLFVFPLTFFANTSEIYRFAGPVIGVITSISLFLLLKETFISRYSRYILLLILCLPIFNQLFLQEIGFFSTSLSFIFLPALIFIIANNSKIVSQIKLFVVFATITAALSLTLPYLYIQYLPALVVLFLIALLFKKYLKNNYVNHLLTIMIISIIGFAIAFGHVYLQTKVLKRATSFPAMELTYLDNGEIIKTDNYQASAISSNNQGVDSSSNNTSQNHSARTKIDDFIKNLKQKDIFIQYITPMSNIAWNAFMIKNVRPPNDIFSLGAYLWIALSLILIPLSIKKNNMILFTISVFSFVFGISTQLGVLEISTYRGRSGWYLMLLTSIGLAFIIDYLISKRIDGKKIILPIIAVMGIVGIIKPPIYYRPYYTEPYKIIKDVIQKSPESSVNIIASDKRLSVLSDKITIKILAESAMQETCKKDICFVVLEKHLMTVDPVLSQQASAIDKNFRAFTQEQTEAKERHTEEVQKIKKTSEFSTYKPYWEDNNIEIFEKGLYK